jgi:hypothetical protein
MAVRVGICLLDLTKTPPCPMLGLSLTLPGSGAEKSNHHLALQNFSFDN